MEGRHSKQALEVQAESSQRTQASMGKRSRERRKRVLAAARAAKRQQDATTTAVVEESQNERDLDDDHQDQHRHGADGPDLARPRKRPRAQADKGTGRPEEGDHRDTKPETNGLAHPSSSSLSCAARTDDEDDDEVDVDDDDDDGGKNKDRAAIIKEGLAWLQNKDAVSMHLSKIDLVEKLEHAGGLVRIENFLPSAAAEAALHILETLPESRWEVRRDADDTQRNATAHRFYVASARGRKDPLALVRRAVQNLLPEKKAVISAGKYSAGDHIAPHDDLGYHREDGKLWSRDVAVIFYLTKDWTKADGGALLDLDPGAQRSSYVPLFNSLVSFVVPREHAVTAVRPRTGRAPRYSLFGWFLVEGDLYRFEPESHGKNAAKKAKTKGGNSQVGNRTKSKGRGKTKRNGRR